MEETEGSDGDADAEDPDLDEKATKNILLSTLKMQETNALTDRVTSQFLSYTKDVLAENVGHLKSRVDRCLNAEGTSITEVEGLEEVFNTPLPFERAFERLKTVEQRTEYAIRNLSMVVSFFLICCMTLVPKTSQRQQTLGF